MKKLKSHLFFVFIFLIFTAFVVAIKNNNPSKIENISLANNEIYPIKGTDKYNYHRVPYGWASDANRPWDETGKLGIQKTNLANESPIILRSIETIDYSFENLKEDCLKEINDLRFPIYYERMGGGVTNDYINNIFSSKTARKEFFNYVISNFENFSSYYPNSWKKNMIDVIDDCFLFTKTYMSKREYYLQLSKKDFCNENPNGQSVGNGFAYKIGYYNSFIFRRIEYNKIPIQEINSYLMILKSKLLVSINDNSNSNYKDVIINNGDIILSDYIVNGKEAIIKVWNKNSKKELIFNSFSYIKCIRENEKNYYVIFQNGKNTLIDTDLNIINESKIEKNIERDEILEKYYPLSNYKIINSGGTNNSSNKVNMTKKNGVYYVPTKVNGIPMEFIFDTGASNVSISLTEALFLFKNGKLAKSDILGRQYFSDATGNISVGTKIILREIKIGNKIIYNIEANVVHNSNAPLLIGESALEKLGKITFDTNNKTLSFE